MQADRHLGYIKKNVLHSVRRAQPEAIARSNSDSRRWHRTTGRQARQRHELPTSHTTPRSQCLQVLTDVPELLQQNHTCRRVGKALLDGRLAATGVAGLNAELSALDRPGPARRCPPAPRQSADDGPGSRWAT
eukprot:8131657-Pyramimonas_sp.AAC.1